MAITSIPYATTDVMSSAFEGCTGITILHFDGDMTAIGYEAFKNCTNLTTVYIWGTGTTLSSTAFRGCTNLTSIKVPWAQGAVKDAPWGATNATITYNYTGEGK